MWSNIGQEMGLRQKGRTLHDGERGRFTEIITDRVWLWP